MQHTHAHTRVAQYWFTADLYPTNFDGSRSVRSSGRVVVERLIDGRAGHGAPSPRKLVNRQMAGGRQSQFRVSGRRRTVVVVRAYRRETALVLRHDAAAAAAAVFRFGVFFEEVRPRFGERLALVRIAAAAAAAGHFRALRAVADGRRRVATANLQQTGTTIIRGSDGVIAGARRSATAPLGDSTGSRPYVCAPPNIFTVLQLKTLCRKNVNNSIKTTELNDCLNCNRYFYHYVY